MRTHLYTKGALAVFASLLIVIACKTGAGSAVSVEAEASRAFYNTMGLGGGTTAPVEYKVKVTIRNTGTSALTWDQLQAEFYPEHGRHLTIPMFPYDPEKGGDERAYQQGGKKSLKLAPGASQDFEFGTDGYTFDLLGEADRKPLRFSVAVLFDGTAIAGPYVALLPPLNDLPSYERALVAGGNGQKPVKLSFSN